MAQYPEWARLTDEQLDGAYAAYFDARMHQFLRDSGLTSEIVDRLAGAWSFVVGAFGIDRFPKYAARVGFSTTQAQVELGASARDAGSVVARGAGAVAMIVASIGAIALIVALR